MRMRTTMYIPLLALCALAMPAYATTLSGSLSGGSVTSMPVASPAAGTYTASQSVSLAATGASSISYTTDGTDPLCGISTTYATAVDVSSSLTLKAMSCYAGATSTVASFAYVINIPVPVVSGGGGGGNGPIVGTYGVSNGSGATPPASTTGNETPAPSDVVTSPATGSTPGADTVVADTPGGNTSGGATVVNNNAGGGSVIPQNTGGVETEPVATNTPETMAISSTPTDAATQAAAVGLAGGFGETWYWWLFLVLMLTAAYLYRRNRRNRRNQEGR